MVRVDELALSAIQLRVAGIPSGTVLHVTSSLAMVEPAFRDVVGGQGVLIGLARQGAVVEGLAGLMLLTNVQGFAVRPARNRFTMGLQIRMLPATWIRCLCRLARLRCCLVHVVVRRQLSCWADPSREQMLLP